MSDDRLTCTYAHEVSLTDERYHAVYYDIIYNQKGHCAKFTKFEEKNSSIGNKYLRKIKN